LIFVDTGAFLARYLKRDEHHETALRGFRDLEGRPAATSTHVLDETFTLLGRWAGNRFAAERARAILASPSLRILRPTAGDEVAALDDFERHADQRVSYTDALSFVLMRARGIHEAFAFDRHFALAGFTLWPPAGGEAGN
jgi:predicted nucleic acid-binding protein